MQSGKMDKSLEIRENQNIFDVCIELGGSLEGSIFALIEGTPNLDWEPPTGSLIVLSFPNDLPPDPQAIDLLKRRQATPSNKQFPAGTIDPGVEFDSDFVYDPGTGTGGGSVIPGIGNWQVGVNFKVSSSQQLPGVGSWIIETDFIISEDPPSYDLENGGQAELNPS